MSETGCDCCDTLRAALAKEQGMRAALEQQSAELQAECARLHIELAETIKLAELQRADLERFKKACPESKCGGTVVSLEVETARMQTRGAFAARVTAIFASLVPDACGLQ